MITIITGVPGDGKTLYAVDQILRPLVGSTIQGEVDGAAVTIDRIVYSNINGLVLDHELIDGSDTGGLRNWQEWARPGSVIVFDEVQKVWPPRANGSKVPADIMALETHRHMGVDFVLITQGPALIDRNLHMLCGRHLHVRRVANLPLATVYEWDAMSRTLNYKSSVRRHKYWFNKAAYKLYKSSVLHTRSSRRLPAVLLGLVLAGGLLAWKGPIVYASLQGQPAAKVEAVAVAPATGAASLKAVAASAGSDQVEPLAGKADQVEPLAGKADQVEPLAGKADQVESPAVVGCVRTADRCACYTGQGVQVEAELGYCESLTRARLDVLAGGSFDWAASTVRLDSPPVLVNTVVNPRAGLPRW